MPAHPRTTAVCADGSPGHYYMAPNATSDSFVFYLQGGAGCAHNQTLCEELLLRGGGGAPLFTSKGFPDSISGYGLLSPDVEENVLYSTYNRIYLPYCTMDMYLMDTETSDGVFHFRGRALLK